MGNQLDPLHVNYIQSAWSEVNRLHSQTTPRLLPLTRSEVEEVLGEKVQDLALWLNNRNSRIYRVELANGQTVVAKQMCTQTQTEVAQEYKHLVALAQLNVPGLAVPQPIALLQPQCTYLMGLARGIAMTVLVGNRYKHDELLRACDVTGKVLASVHAAWGKTACPVPVEALSEDLAAKPGGWSDSEHETIQRALDRLAPQFVAVGQPYLDFGPLSIFWQEKLIWLIDPPSESARGLLLWDFASFCMGLRLAIWKHTLRRPWQRSGALLQASLTAFERGYLKNSPNMEPSALRILSRVLELQRVGQIAVWQKKNPLYVNGRRIRSIVSVIGAAPLLRANRRRLINQINQDLF